MCCGCTPVVSPRLMTGLKIGPSQAKPNVTFLSGADTCEPRLAEAGDSGKLHVVAIDCGCTRTGIEVENPFEIPPPPVTRLSVFWVELTRLITLRNDDDIDD